MSTVLLKGNPIRLEGKLPATGDKAPAFHFIKQDLSQGALSDYSGKVKVILAVPSLDTPVCARETREFNVKLSGMKDTVVLVLSGDLPFAMKRYCAAEGVENVVTGSQYRDMNFSKAYGTHVAEGALAGLSARAVFVVDKEDVVRYVELVGEIGQEPNYGSAVDAVKQLI